jgi:hypothetical protein
LSNLKSILYQKQWKKKGANIKVDNEKLNNLEVLRKMNVKENYYLFQNYKDLNLIIIKK